MKREERSWALKAVEDEAMRRAFAYAMSPEYLKAHLTILGLTLKQILYLKTFYEKQTGAIATDIETD